MTALAPPLAALLAFAIAVATAPRLARRNARRGHVDRPGGRKTQADAVPFGGGTALWLGTLVPGLLALLAAGLHEAGVLPLPAALAEHAPGALRAAPQLLAIAGGALLLALVGRRDDARGLPIAPRLLAQFAAAGLVAASGTRLGLYLGGEAAGIAVTIVFIVFLTNAFNFIDNMDGLAAGVGLASSLGIAAVGLADGQLFAAAFAFALAGAFGGILVHNAAPARLYLGDEGSGFGGFALAAAAILVSYRSESGGTTPVAYTFLAPALLLGVPLADGLFVCTSRLARGISPWTAGRDHLSHRLAERSGPRVGVRRLVAAAFAAAAAAQLLYARAGLPLLAALALAAGAVLALRLGRRGGAR
ncbi:MAG: MraY family glycosyltransferase [Planctomycetota bacterium]